MLERYRTDGVDAPLDLVLQSPEWQPLVAFAARWFARPFGAATGLGIEELNAFEKEHGLRRPPCVREYLRIAGKHPYREDQTCQDYETDYSFEADAEKPGRLLTVYGENQGIWTCGILRENLGAPNPPVHMRADGVDFVGDIQNDDTEVVDGIYIRVCDRFTDFLLGVLVRHVVLRLNSAPSFKRDVCGGNVEIARSHLPKDVECQQIFSFPAGFDPYLGEEFILVDGWGLAAVDRLTYRALLGLDPEWTT